MENIDNFLKDIIVFNDTLETKDQYTSLHVGKDKKYVMINFKTIDGLTQTIVFASYYSRNFNINYYKKIDQHCLIVKFD